MDTCEVSTCEKPVYTKRLCKAHYQRMWRTGSAESDSTVTYTRVRNGKVQEVTRRVRSSELGGWARTSLYKRWNGMMRRCYEPAAQNYKWYGGKGVTVCDEWQDFFGFRDWAHANGYDDSLELDRIDTALPYAPYNCRWLPKRENVKRARVDTSVWLSADHYTWLRSQAVLNNQSIEEALDVIMSEARGSAPTVRRRRGGDAE